MSTCFYHKPYTYLLKWHTGAWYYGVRYAKDCSPEDLWKTYFTSSKHVKKYVEKEGNPTLIQVRRVFETADEARLWEHKVLRRLRAVTRSDSLNQTDNKAINPLVSSIKKKGKTYEEIYGFERAQELRRKRKESNSRRNRINWSDEARKKAVLRNSGGNNPRALKVFLEINHIQYKFETIKAAANHLSSVYGYKISTCVSAIRTKLDNPTKTTDKKAFQPLYECFSARYV